MENYDLEFFGEWLPLEKYHFKLLTMITVLADNDRAFRGKLSDLCRSLAIQPSAGNVNKMRKSLVYLEDNGYIRTIEDDRIFTISLAAAAEKSKKIIKIKKAWYKLIRETRSEAAWESVLKVFLILWEMPKDETITYKQIGERISLSSSTVERCVKTICSIDFGDFRYKKTCINEKDSEGNICGKGQTYEKVLLFE